MKYLLGFLSGFSLTLVVFVSGAAVTIVHLTAEPVPDQRFNTRASEPLTNDESIRVVDANQDSATLVSQSGPERSGTPTQARSTEVHEDKLDSEQAIDPVITASATPEPSTQSAPELSAAHVAWCSQRYRSYNPEDNRYNAYSGKRRECDSPYSSDSSGSSEQQTTTMSASAEGHLDPEHVQSCLARYRSYRPEDNTYQPYGGGPRRQCE